MFGVWMLAVSETSAGPLSVAASVSSQQSNCIPCFQELTRLKTNKHRPYLLKGEVSKPHGKKSMWNG